MKMKKKDDARFNLFKISKANTLTRLCNEKTNFSEQGIKQKPESKLNVEDFCVVRDFDVVRMMR
jgi:hypothetical protein